MKSEKENIVLTKDEFQKIQSDIELLKGAVSTYKLQEQEALRAKASKKSPRGFLKRIKAKSEKGIDGNHLVVGWKGVKEDGSKAKQEIIYNGTTPVGEKLVSHFLTIDGDDVVCDFVKLIRSNDIERFSILSKDGDYMTISFDNPELPQEYRIKDIFINP
jgi:hypothetical protein